MSNYHTENLRTIVCENLEALACVAPYMNLAKKKTRINNFFRSQINYFSLFWMCHNRASNNKLNTWVLRLTYNHKPSTVKQLLDKDSSIPIQIKNLVTLTIEIYKVVIGSFPLIMNEIFKLRDEGRYNLRH